MVQIKEKKRNKYTSKSTVPVHFESSSPDDIWKNEKATKGPRTGGKGGCLPKATRGSTFSSFLTADSLELFSLSCLWGLTAIIPGLGQKKGPHAFR
jgi:hypothetical protein